MSRTPHKICVVTNARDAAMAADAGADAIGLVFYGRAPRFVAPDRAREILNALPPFVSPVGLFVDSPVEQILEIATTLRLRAIQLHGNETPEDIEALRAFTVIKAMRVTRDRFTEELNEWRDAIDSWSLKHLRGLILETATTKQQPPGGTGIANDWKLIAEAKSSGALDGLPSIILAGGLTPQNVGQVVRDLRPWAVDVSSGVESSLGQKSQEKVEAFVNAVRETS